MFVGAIPQALALLGTRVWVRRDTIRELRVQPFSGRSVPSIGCVLLHTGGDNGSSRLLPFLSGMCGARAE